MQMSEDIGNISFIPPDWLPAVFTGFMIAAQNSKSRNEME